MKCFSICSRIDLPTLKRTAEKVGGQELAGRCHILGEVADAPQLAGERALRIVDQFLDRLRYLAIVPPLAPCVERTLQRAAVEHEPKEAGSSALRSRTTVVATRATPSPAARGRDGGGR